MPRYKYATEGGQIVQVRLSAAKFALTGGEPAGGITDLRFNATVGGSKRSRNTLVTRGVVYTREDTVGDTGRVSSQRLFIPVLDPLNLPTRAATVTYKGKADWKIAGVEAEG